MRAWQDTSVHQGLLRYNEMDRARGCVDLSNTVLRRSVAQFGA